MQAFLLSRRVKKGTAWISSGDDWPGAIIVHCGFCGVQGSRPMPLTKAPKVSVYVDRPGTVDDIVRLGFLIAVSKRFQDCCRVARLTGINFVEPFEIATREEGKSWGSTVDAIVERRLRLAWVTGTCGSIVKLSGMRLKSKCGGCGWEEWTRPAAGIRIDPKQWDGSDFFHANLNEFPPMLMSARATEALEAAGLSNFEVADAAKKTHAIALAGR
jgi:hypothetical protein